MPYSPNPMIINLNLLVSVIFFPKIKETKKLPIGLAAIMNPKIDYEIPLSMAKGGKNGVINEEPIMVRQLHACNNMNFVVLFIN